jgi:iron complex transport system ATP-binding protein
LVVVNGGTIEATGSPEKVLTEGLVDKVFDVKATITRHPVANTPLVIT